MRDLLTGERQMGCQPLEIAVLVQPSTGWGRDIIRGIVRYAQLHASWRFFTSSPTATGKDLLPRWWNGDGVIGRVTETLYDSRLIHLPCPVVNISATFAPRFPYPRVVANYERAGQMAAEHLIDRGFRQFACLTGHIPTPHVNGFLMTLREQGLPCFTRVDQPQDRRRRRSQMAHSDLAQWLEPLPKPLGVLAYHDEMGRRMIDACVWNNMHIPDEVAVVGIMNDTLICEISNPPLSSVALDAQRQGYEAAALLDRMIQGDAAPHEPIFIDPQFVAMRQTTDTLAVPDPEIAEAIRFIRDNVGESIRVKDLLRLVPTSRRSLERRFLRYLGRTPADEIRRVRLERLKRLLEETGMKGASLAAASGFANHSYMVAAFRREMGMTPEAYRRHRGGRVGIKVASK